MDRTRRTLISLLFLALSCLPAGADDPDGAELPRKAFLGTALGPLSDEVREAQVLGEEVKGAVVLAVIADSSAAEADLRPGDLVQRAGKAEITGPADLVRSLAGQHPGETAKFTLLREGKPMTVEVKLKERPRESSPEYDVSYGAVTTRGHRLRTVMTKPRGDGPFPALMVIQGLGLATVDNPIGPLASYRILCDDLTRRGFVTLRVDKPGVGDSEGGPGRDVDFETELDGYRQALKRLATTPFVDPRRILIFGHSMGGAMAPLLAADVPVRGIAVYGTLAKTWHEYMLENVRRQLELAGQDAGVIDDAMKVEAAVLHELFTANRTPSEIAEKHPELAARLEEITSDDRYYVDRHLDFFRQLASKSLGDAWQNYGGSVLAIWGKSDFVSAEADHALIARIVNKEHPGRAQFLALEGIDHGLTRAATPEVAIGREQGQPPAEFNPRIVEVLREWAEAATASK